MFTNDMITLRCWWGGEGGIFLNKPFKQFIGFYIGNSQFMWADFNEPRDLMEPVILKTNNVVRFSKYKSGVQYV